MHKIRYGTLSLVAVLLLAGCTGERVSAPAAGSDQAALIGSDALLLAGHGHHHLPGVIPPHARPQGQSYAEWSSAWWHWLWEAPVDVNPGLDHDGHLVSYGQSGSVWFLAPNYGGRDVRYATIPTGKMLFVDVAGFFTSFELEPYLQTVEELRASNAAAVEGITEIVLMIDGATLTLEDLQDYRVQSPEFEYILPDNNMFEYFGYSLPAGTYEPGVADGYYVMLAPLSAGEHTIYIFADLGDVYGTSEVTFHLTVGNAHQH